MSLAKKSWKRAIALFLAVVMAIAFAPNIVARADYGSGTTAAFVNAGTTADAGTGRVYTTTATSAGVYTFKMSGTDQVTTIVPNFSITTDVALSADGTDVASGTTLTWSTDSAKIVKFYSIEGTQSTSKAGTFTITIKGKVEANKNFKKNLTYTANKDSVSRAGSVVDSESLILKRSYTDAASATAALGVAPKYAVNYTYGSTDKLSPKVIVHTLDGTNADAVDAGFDTGAAGAVEWYYVDKTTASTQAKLPSGITAVNSGAELAAQKTAVEAFFDTTTGALKEGLSTIVTQSVPKNANDYWVVAVVAGDDRYAPEIIVDELHINPLAIKIVPDKSQGTVNAKTYGNPDEDITFKAYSYLNTNNYKYGEKLEALAESIYDYTNLDVNNVPTDANDYADQVGDTPFYDVETANDVFVRYTAAEFEANKKEYIDLAAKIKESPSYADEKVQDVLYAGTIDQTDARVLTRAGYGFVAGENAGSYAIDLNDHIWTNATTESGDPNPAYTAAFSNYAFTLAGDAVSYVISPRSIKGTGVQVGLLDETSALTDYTKIPTRSNSTYTWTGKTITPGYKVVEEISKLTLKTGTETPVDKVKDRAVYSKQTQYIGVVKGDTKADVSGITNSFAPSGEQAGSGSGTYTITLEASGNYTDSRNFDWIIGPSNLAFDAVVLDEGYSVVGDNEANVLEGRNNVTLTVPYDGLAHKVGSSTTNGVYVYGDHALKNGASTPATIAATDYTVTYKILEDYDTPDANGDGTFDGAITHVKATEDYTLDAFPKNLVYAGEYKIGYKVSSNYHDYDDTFGTITVNILPVEYDYTTANFGADAGETKTAIDKKAATANGVVNGKIYENYGENNQTTVANTEKLVLGYSYDETATKTEGSTDVTAYRLEADNLKSLVTAAHKAAFEGGKNCTEANEVKDNVNNWVVLCSANYNQAVASVGETAWNDDVKAARSWDSLTADQQAALIKTDLDAAEYLRRFNDNYKVNIEKGTLTLKAAQKQLAVIVHDFGAWDPEKKVWNDFDVADGGWKNGYAAYGKENGANTAFDAGTDDNTKWNYGLYDLIGKAVEVVALQDGVPVALPENFADYLSFNCYIGNTTSYVFLDKSMAELESELFALPVNGETGYTLQATLKAVPGEALTSYATSGLFTIGPSTLKIDADSNNKVSGGTVTRGVAPEELTTLVVRSINGTETGLTPFQASADTYAFAYSVDNGAHWYGSLADEHLKITENAAQIMWYATSADKATVKVKAVPVAKMAASWAESAVVDVEFEVVATAATDEIRDYEIKHTADKKGATVTVGLGDGALTRTYGTYTFNKILDDGTYETSSAHYISDTADNEITFDHANGLLWYAETELLYSNKYAVGRQNTFVDYEKLTDNKVVLKRYEDAEKVAFYPYYGADLLNNYGPSDDIDSEGLITNATMITALDNKRRIPAVNYLGGNQTSENYIWGETHFPANFDTDTANGVHRDRAAAAVLLAGVAISDFEVTDNEDGIIALKSVTTATGTTQAPNVSLTGNTLKYVLDKDAKSGDATIKVTVKRKNVGNVTFNVKIVLDAEVPEIAVKNAKLADDPSTTINAKAKVTDVYVNEALKFEVTAKGAEEGLWYIFEDSAKTVGQLNDDFAAEKFTKLEDGATEIATPEKEGGYILYVRGADEAGNVTYVSSAKGYTVDLTKPEIKDANDSSVVFSEDKVETLAVDEGKNGAFKVSDAKLKENGVTATVDGAAVEVGFNSTTKNYELPANENTYTVQATDEAGNVTTVKMDVNQKVNNVANNITLTYKGDNIDLATLVDPADAEKKLFVIDENAGAASYENATDEEKDGKHVYAISGVRGEGEIVGTELVVKKTGTFAIKLVTEKNGIFARTETVALLTVNTGKHQVGVTLVEDKTAADAKAKTEFTDTEVKNIKDYIKYVFNEGEDYVPEDKDVTVNFYKKGSDTKETVTPSEPGEYEISIDIAEDGLFEACSSLNATDDKVKDLKKASFTLGATNKVVIDNGDGSKGTVTVTIDGKEATADDLLKVAKGAKVVIEVAPANGFTFEGWTDESGIIIEDKKATKLETTVASDIAITATYAEGIKIETQPKSQDVLANETATFTVVATGNGEDDLTYQWMTKSATEVNFKAIEGATAATYTTDKLAASNDGDCYKVVLTSKSTKQTVDSEVATVKVSGHSIEGAVITLKEASAVYTGKNIDPVIDKVMLGDGAAAIELVSTRDFDVVAAERVNVGEYEVKIVGKGNWSGEATAKFTITPKAITADMFTIEDAQYTGKAIEAPVVAKDGEKELVADTDFTVAYKNNTEVGTATATVTGKGNYTGSVDVKFAILGESIAKATVTGISTAAYTGKAITPTPVVKLNGKTLKKGTDYTVSYKNNTKVGTATVTITGKGDYSGKITKKFLIKQISFKYRAYVQKKNWMSWSTAKVSGTSASKMAGTTDNLRMETIQMQLSGVSGQVKYRAYVEKMGWTQWATTADTTTYAGTKGLSRRVEMIQLQASGQVATLYDMYYRTYCEKFGWLGWVKSGEKSGSAGYARKLEAFQINFVRKGESFTVKSDTTKGFYDSAKDGKNPK